MPEQFKCPTCGDTTNIDVDATVRVRILQDEDGNYETDADASEDGSHDWDDNSLARCAGCGYVGIIETFQVANGPGLCVTCGTQCEARPDLSVICPKCEAAEPPVWTDDATVSYADPHPRWCECGRDWDDCSTRDSADPDAEHQDRLLQTETPHRGIVAY